MALSVHEELRKLDDLYRVKADLEQLPYYLRFHPQTTRHFRDLIEETVVSLARCADRRLPGTPQDNIIENILDLRRRWLGSGPLEFQANSRCLSQLDSIVINELKRLSECNTRLLFLRRPLFGVTQRDHLCFSAALAAGHGFLGSCFDLEVVLIPFDP